MTEAEIQSIALFFYFALLDDKKAIEASTQTLALCRARLRKDSNLKSSIAIVSSTKIIWDKIKSKVPRGRIGTTLGTGWIIPDGLDMGPWREFQKNAPDDELLVVIWSKILKIDDQDISEGLRITAGTIRYRLSRSLRRLGAMAQNLARAAGKLQDESSRK